MFAPWLDVIGNILVILSPHKVSFEVKDGHIKVPVTLSMGWKRGLLVALVLAGLFFLAEVGSGNSAISRLGIAAMVAALKDPLAVFNERSPGKRSGALLSIKKGAPHERVLSTVRERPSPPWNTCRHPAGCRQSGFRRDPCRTDPGHPACSARRSGFRPADFRTLFPGCGWHSSGRAGTASNHPDHAARSRNTSRLNTARNNAAGNSPARRDLARATVYTAGHHTSVRASRDNRASRTRDLGNDDPRALCDRHGDAPACAQWRG
jgi:hypothetical protein